MKLIDNNINFILMSEDSEIQTFDCGNSSINRYLRSSALLDTLTRKGSTTLVLDETELVGFFTLSRVNIEQINTEAIIVQYLAVSKDKQDTGIGSKIIEFIVNIALATNERYIFLEALKDDGHELINWYEKRGFIIVDPEVVTDPCQSTAWMFVDLLDQDSLNKMFNEP